jgi:hypothetical protein
MELVDLVVLQYASNPCYVQVVSPSDVEGLKIDLANKTFSYERSENIPFAKTSYPPNKVISVYVKADLKHLDSMVHAAREATQADKSW